MDINLCDPHLWGEGVPHEAFAWLRKNEPVYFQEQPDGHGFWCLTKYEDVVRASKDYKHFNSAPNTFHARPPEAGVDLMLINLDPPKHTKVRAIVSKGFHPRMIAALEDKIREVVTEILDKVAPKGEADFVTEIAAELPLAVIAELAGIPKEDHHKIFEWSNRMIAQGADPEYAPSIEDSTQAFMDMSQYANMMAELRRHEPREDLVSAIIHSEVDGEKLNELEYDVFFVMLMIAGNETTRNLISGGMLALIENPDQRQKLADNPELFPTAVEEMLRYVTPVAHFVRTVAEDIEIRGRHLPAGCKAALWYSSANRDEDVFENPDQFDVARSPNPHVTFGAGGPHFCMGFSLAQLEIRVMFEEIFKRLPDIELAGEVERLHSFFISGIRHMPVKFTPEKV